MGAEETVLDTPITEQPMGTPEGNSAPETPAGEGEGQGGTAPEGGAENQGTEGQPAKKPIQPRINELVRARHDAERETAYWRGIAEGMTKKATPVDTPAIPAAAQRPTASNFQTYDDYVEALTDWKAEQAVSSALAKTQANAQEQATQQTAAEKEAARTSAWQERQTATKAIHTDYDEVVATSDVPIMPHVTDLLLDSEQGPAIAYKLAKDPELAAKLNGMSEREATKAFARLEDAISKTAPVAGTTTPVVSNAPPPPTPVQTRSATSKSVGQMSMDEYVEYRKKLGLR